MIIHTCENGQRVSFPTAERSEVRDGFIHFFDLHDEEVGLQPLPAGAEPPQEPPSVTTSSEPEEEKPNDELSKSATPASNGSGIGETDSNGSVHGGSTDSADADRPGQNSPESSPS